MATIPDWRPELIGPTPIRDWSSSWFSFSAFLEGLKGRLEFLLAGVLGL